MSRSYYDFLSPYFTSGGRYHAKAPWVLAALSSTWPGMSDPPQQGRRAGARRAQAFGDGDANAAKAASGWDTPEKPADAEGEDGDGPQHGRRKGGAASGWGESTTVGEDEPVPKPPTPPPAARRGSPDSDDNDNIQMLIPDLEEEEEEEEARQVAVAAPTRHEMMTIDELDHGMPLRLCAAAPDSGSYSPLVCTLTNIL